MHKNPVDLVTMILLIVGGLNWGLVGVMNLDLVATLFGVGTLLAQIVYILVGLSALYMLYRTLTCKECKM